MKHLKTSFLFTMLLIAFVALAQQPGQRGGQGGGGTVKITGKVIDQDSKQPLEFTNVIVQSLGDVTVAGGLTDANGQYSLDVKPGTYNIKFDFISFKAVTLSNKEITADTNLGTTAMAPDATVLKGVEITAERSTVEIKLDKRVYSVGNDMMVKGGTVSDVLDNVPSLSVDAEGNVALRGNQSVTILIDGRPSNLAGSNVAETLRLLPADSVDKVEVITNPSARYDAEGGGGIVNIILKKGKANGFNGSVVANVGDPANHGISTNLNYRGENYNVFSNLGYNYRNNPGRSLTNSRYLDADTNETSSYTDEKRRNKREREGFNASVGLEWFLDKTLTWTNSISVRRNTGESPTWAYFDNYLADHSYNYSTLRYTHQDDDESNVNFGTNLVKKFNDKGHELRIDASVSKNIEDQNANITNSLTGGTIDFTNTQERTTNDQDESRGLIQADYVLPIGDNSRFEAGYRGSFSTLETDARAETLQSTGWENNANYTNYLQYKEKINALYSQFGSKTGKFSYLFGLRWEDSNIDVNLLNVNEYHNKRYNNFFPSAVLGYEFSSSSNISLSYSRRINRPRGRFLNPFSGLQSNINLFRGNPELNPSKTHAIDLGYLKKWDKLMLNSSVYVNITQDNFQFVRTVQGETAEGTPITLTTPINLAKEYRAGFEFNANYTPYKWWRLNGNLNIFRNETQGEYNYSYTLSTGEVVSGSQNFNNTAYTWTTRLNSKITLPWKIDWQLNGSYEAPQKNAQGKRLSQPGLNTALSKDILKDKGTIALNVQDIFNSRKMRNQTYIPYQVDSYSSMQWRVRQVTLSLTYRFNRSKNDKQKEQQRQDNGGGDEYMGG